MNNNCAFERNEYTCAALSVKSCKGCPFFKTQEELDAGRERADERIATLPEEQQEHIKKKYRSYSSVCWVGEKDV